MTRLWAFAALAIMTTAANPALSQKSKDTLRYGMAVTLPTLSPYHLTQEDAGVFYRDTYEFLMFYDEHKKQFIPGLAKSWKQIDDKTIEFELREDIKFHNGNSFTASDVRETIHYLIDPVQKVQQPERYNWITNVEILNPYRLRVHSEQPIGDALIRLAYRFPIWDGKALSGLEDKADYGRLSPIGTGPYKITQVDRNKGIVIEQFDAYNTNTEYKKAKIRRLVGVPILDRQTQAAEMMAGNIDIIRQPSDDLAKELAERPDIDLTYIRSPNMNTLLIDSVGRSGDSPLKDLRVRKAVFMSIDRDSFVKFVVPGGEKIAQRPNSACFESMISCAPTTQPPAFDIAGAKKLLAEAGYPNGFEMRMTLNPAHRYLGEALIGDLRKVGINVKLELAETSLVRRLASDGKLQSWVDLRPMGVYPDTGNHLLTYFRGTYAQYFDDKFAVDSLERADTEFDINRRTQIYSAVLNRMNEQAYVLPLAGIPTSWVHTKDMKIVTNTISVGENFAIDFAWK